MFIISLKVLVFSVFVRLVINYHIDVVSGRRRWNLLQLSEPEDGDAIAETSFGLRKSHCSREEVSL